MHIRRNTVNGSTIEVFSRDARRTRMSPQLITQTLLYIMAAWCSCAGVRNSATSASPQTVESIRPVRGCWKHIGEWKYRWEKRWKLFRIMRRKSAFINSQIILTEWCFIFFYARFASLHAVCATGACRLRRTVVHYGTIRSGPWIWTAHTRATRVRTRQR